MDIDQIKLKIAQMKKEIARKQQRLLKWEKAAWLLKNPATEEANPASKSSSSDEAEEPVVQKRQESFLAQSSSSGKLSTVKVPLEKSSTSATAKRSTETKASAVDPVEPLQKNICVNSPLKSSKIDAGRSPRTPASVKKKPAVAEVPKNLLESKSYSESVAESSPRAVKKTVSSPVRTAESRRSGLRRNILTKFPAGSEMVNEESDDSSSESPEKTCWAALDGKNVQKSQICDEKASEGGQGSIPRRSTRISEGGQGSIPRRSTRKVRSSYILKSQEYIMLDPWLVKGIKSETEDDVQNVESDRISIKEAESDTEIDIRFMEKPESGIQNVENDGRFIRKAGPSSQNEPSGDRFKEGLGISGMQNAENDGRSMRKAGPSSQNEPSGNRSVECLGIAGSGRLASDDKDVLKHAAEFNSGDIQVAESGNALMLRRSVRKPRSSYILSSHEYVMDPRVAKGKKLKAESDAWDTKSDCGSSESLETFSVSLEDENMRKFEDKNTKKSKYENTRQNARKSDVVSLSGNLQEVADIDLGSTLRRSARQSQRSRIVSSGEFIMLDSRTKSDEESDESDAENVSSSSCRLEILPVCLDDKSVTKSTGLSHSGTAREFADTGSGSTLRRSARQLRNSCILNSDEFILLDSRPCRGTKSDARNAENAESDSSSPESLEILPVCRDDENLARSDAEVTCIAGSTLRRSGRQARSSYILKSQEFVVLDSRLAKGIKSEAESDVPNAETAESDGSSWKSFEILPMCSDDKNVARSDAEIDAGSSLRRSVRRVQSSHIIKSHEFVLPDSWLDKGSKFDAETDTPNAESDSTSSESHQILPVPLDNKNAAETGSQNAKPNIGTVESCATPENPFNENSRKCAAESHSGDLQIAGIDRGSRLRRSVRQSQNSYIQNSDEFIMLDSRLCDGAKAESDTQDTESDDSSKENLAAEECSRASSRSEDVTKSELEPHSGDVRFAEGGRSSRLRRSERQSRSSYILSSEDFVVPDSRAAKGKKKWSLALRDGSPEPDANPRLFPKVPSAAVAGPVVEFCLPDDEFEVWKRRLRHRDQDSEDEPQSGSEPLRRSESWTVLGQFEAGTEEDSNVEIQQTALSEFQASVELKCSTCEPVELVHCGRIRVGTNGLRRAVVACQKCKISVWTEIGVRWLLLVEIPITPMNVKFNTFSGFSIENCIGVALVKATLRERTVWSYDLSLGGGGRCLESATLKKPVQRICAILSCVVGETLICATMDSRATYLTTYSLKRQENMRPKDMEKVEDVVNTLLPVADLDHAVIGFSASLLYIWNHQLGDLVKRIHAPDRATFLKCVFAQEESGLLILGVITGGENPQHNLMAVNPSSEKWRILHPYQEVVEIPNQNLTGAFQVESYLMAGGGETGRVAIWNIFSGHLVAFLNDTSVTAFGTFPTESSSDFLVATGSRSGHVTMYKLPLSQL